MLKINTTSKSEYIFVLLKLLGVLYKKELLPKTTNGRLGPTYQEDLTYGIFKEKLIPNMLSTRKGLDTYIYLNQKEDLINFFPRQEWLFSFKTEKNKEKQLRISGERGIRERQVSEIKQKIFRYGIPIDFIKIKHISNPFGKKQVIPTEGEYISSSSEKLCLDEFLKQGLPMYFSPNYIKSLSGARDEGRFWKAFSDYLIGTLFLKDGVYNISYLSKDLMINKFNSSLALEKISVIAKHKEIVEYKRRLITFTPKESSKEIKLYLNLLSRIKKVYSNYHLIPRRSGEKTLDIIFSPNFRNILKKELHLGVNSGVYEFLTRDYRVIPEIREKGKTVVIFPEQKLLMSKLFSDKNLEYIFFEDDHFKEFKKILRKENL
ncbi:MAG: hypothetical protein LBD41_04435 [Clostridiales Family XIII bacterium]|jgi:hypothetical protein|nr:hypothetical protein [Clostridiales Family XIII bacterium]